MLPLVASVLLVLVVAPKPTFSQSTESTEPTPTVTTITTTIIPITSQESSSTTTESSTPTITTLPSTTTTSAEHSTSASSPSPPEGSIHSPCNATYDCQPNKNLQCLEGTCHCPTPQVFDLRVERCVIPLGKQCDSSDILGENMCPESAECFMDRCVCKTGYSMHTLTRCKSDFIEDRAERKPIVLWPPPPSSSVDSNEKGSCNSETCDESKGLVCQLETCKCKDSKEIYVEEFGRCLNTTMQKTLKDALALVTTSEDEIQSFVKLLEKIDDVDQETGNSDHYNSPVHQLLGLLGGDAYRGGATLQPSSASQLAPPSYSYRGDLHGAAQEPVPETAVPAASGAPTIEGGSNDGPSAGASAAMGERAVSEATGGNNGPAVPETNISPVSQANAESSTESGEALAYSQESIESIKKPSPAYPSLPLDNLQYSPQSQEPQIVQRQAPPYLQGLGGLGGENHLRLPIQGQGGLGGFGGQGFGGQGYGGIGYGDGGFGQGGFGGFGGPQGQFGGFGGPQGGFGGQGGHLGGGQFGGHHGGGLGGGYGGLGGPPPPPPKPKGEGLLIDVAEFVGRSLKLVDRFLPLVHAINDVLKKEGLFEKKEGGLLGLGGLGGLGGGGGPGGPRGRRFGENSKEAVEEVKEGGILSGFARFVGILIRLKRRLLLSGDDTLKKLLA